MQDFFFFSSESANSVTELQADCSNIMLENKCIMF